jgi:DNA replication protein DnaC
MLVEQTIDKLHQMRLFTMATSFRERMARNEHSEVSISDFIGFIVDDEWTKRENSRSQSRLTKAKFRDKNACVENWDHHQSRGLTKSQFIEFTQNHWLEKNENLIMTGPCGSGKSYLAQALGHHACRSGYSVLYLWLPKFGTFVSKSKAEGSLPSFIKRVEKTKLLILDDWGLTPLLDPERHCLLELIEERYSLGSTVITSQLATADWHAYLGGGNLADSLCDRLIHNAHKIPLKTDESNRKSKNGLAQTKQEGK